MPSPNRITIPLDAEYIDLLKKRADENELAHGKLISCFLTLSAEEIKEIVARALPVYIGKRIVAREARSEARKQIKEQQKEAMKALKTMSPEQINEMLASFNAKGEQK